MIEQEAKETGGEEKEQAVPATASPLPPRWGLKRNVT
jgi:hypothetical protein